MTTNYDRRGTKPTDKAMADNHADAVMMIGAWFFYDSKKNIFSQGD